MDPNQARRRARARAILRLARSLFLTVAVASLAIAALGAAVISGVVDSAPLRALTARVVARNFGQAAPGVYRGGRSTLTATKWLHQMHGFRTVVHLAFRDREADLEEAAYFEEAGVAYHRFAWRPNEVADDEEIARALRIIEEGPHPVFVHCIAGKDRTGGLIGLFEARRGSSLTEITEEWARFGPPHPAWQSAVTSSFLAAD